MKRDPGFYDYLPYSRRPRIEWPNGARVAFWVAPNIEFYELDPPKNPTRTSWPRPVPDVLGCEKIRTRGSADYVFLDLHLWLDGKTPLDAAHATSHVVKDLLMTRFPQLADVVIHIEPPPGPR